MLSGFEKALLGALLFVLMMGMGATLTLEHFRAVLRRPRGVLIGLASQFGWMPLIAFALALATQLNPAMALSLVIVGSTPGGTTSNLFTYYARADLALSVAMTVASTVAAVVVMPLLLLLYSGPFTDASLSVPYGSIVTTLAIMLVPLAVGMVVRAKAAAAAARLERVGSYAGIAVLVMLIVTGVLNNSDMFARIPVGGYVSAILLGLLGRVLGYGAAALARLAPAARRAVALETGIQNSPLALGIVALSFPAQQDEMMLLPLLYALCVLINAALVTAWFRRAAA
jgi:bile acid transporter